MCADAPGLQHSGRIAQAGMYCSRHPNSSVPAKLHTWDEWLHTEAAACSVYAKHTPMATKVTSGTWYGLLSMTRSILFALRVRNELTVSTQLHQSSRKARRNQSNDTVWPRRGMVLFLLKGFWNVMSRDKVSATCVWDVDEMFRDKLKYKG